MAFSLGTLFVDLKANTGQFISDLGKASAQTKAFGRTIESSLGQIGKILAPLGDIGPRLQSAFEMAGSGARSLGTTLGKTRGMLTGLAYAGAGGVTALAGAMLGLAAKSAAVGEKIFEASEKTGIGAAQMSGLAAICKSTGGDFEGLTTALARAGSNLTKAIIEPSAITSKILAQVMGGTKQLSDLGLKPMGDRLQTVMARIFAMNDMGQRNAALSSLLGRGWMENVSALRVLAQQGYGPAIAQAKRFGMFFDDSQARQAKQFTIALREMEAGVSGLGLSIGQKVIPELLKWFSLLQGSGAELKTFAKLAYDASLAMIGDVWAMKDLPKDYQEYKKAVDGATQASTDFQIRTKSLAEGQKAAGEEVPKLTSAVNEQRNAMGDLIQRQKDELESLSVTGKPARALTLEYHHMMEEIDKAVKSGGTFKDSLEALALALEIYHKKLMQIKAEIPTLNVLAQGYGTSSFDRFSGPSIGGVPGNVLPGGMINPNQFPEYVGQFKQFERDLIAEGQNLSGKLLEVIGGTIDKLEDAFAKFAVGGKENFKKLAQGIEESFIKVGLKTAVSRTMSAFGMGSNKRDGNTPNSAIYVMTVNSSGQVLGDITSTVGSSGGSSPSAKITGALASGLPGGAGSLISSLSKTLGNIISGIFGGGMAAGGPVTADQLYMVGEQGPELFAPGISGSVIPAGGIGGNTYHVDARGAYPGAEIMIARAIQGLQKQTPASALAAVYEYQARGGTL